MSLTRKAHRKPEAREKRDFCLNLSLYFAFRKPSLVSKHLLAEVIFISFFVISLISSSQPWLYFKITFTLKNTWHCGQYPSF